VRDARIEPAQSILLWCVLAVDAAVVSREHPCVLLIGPGYQLGVFTSASAGRFELVLTPEPRRQPDTDRGQDEQDHPPSRSPRTLGTCRTTGTQSQQSKHRCRRDAGVICATTCGSRAPLNC
jgi:hypothetical protein